MALSTIIVCWPNSGALQLAVIKSMTWLNLCGFPGMSPAGLEETLSFEDQETLRSSGLFREGTVRLRPTLGTLDASLVEGR